jgi:hypothetical protein
VTVLAVDPGLETVFPGDGFGAVHEVEQSRADRQLIYRWPVEV